MKKVYITFENGINLQLYIKERDQRKFMQRLKIDEKGFLEKFKGYLKGRFKK